MAQYQMTEKQIISTAQQYDAAIQKRLPQQEELKELQSK